jgi:hypothetical protein
MRATPVELGTALSLELVRDGCGRGWHRTRWRDQWGYWQPEGNNPAYHFLGQKEQRGSEGEQRQPWCPPLRDRWFADSPPEEDGFEPLVPPWKRGDVFPEKASSIPVTAAGEFTREGQPGNFG